MKLSELANFVDEQSTITDNILSRCAIFAEASFKEYMSNLKEAELKVIQESGTEDDLAYLKEAAEEGFLVRAKNTLQKIVDSFIQFVQEIYTSIKAFFTKEKTKATLDKANKMCKTNPELKSVKIDIPDVNGNMKLIEEYQSKFDRIIAKRNGGKFDVNDKKDIREIQEEYDKKKKAIATATISVSVATAIGVLAGYMSKVEDKKKDQKDVKNNIKITDDMSPEDVQTTLDGAKCAMQCRKDGFTVLAKGITDTINAITSKITGVGEVDNADNFETKESVNDTPITNDESGVNLNSLLDQIMCEVQESATTESGVSAEAYLESLETDLFDSNDHEDVHTTLESVEEELFSSDTNSKESPITVGAYLESLEAELSNEDETYEEGVSAEEFLDQLESEIFG